MNTLLCRPQRKQLHAALHSIALVCIVGAVAAAIRSHTLKRPTPTPNFYSPHSWLGLGTLSIIAVQVNHCLATACTRTVFAAPASLPVTVCNEQTCFAWLCSLCTLHCPDQPLPSCVSVPMLTKTNRLPNQAFSKPGVPHSSCLVPGAYLPHLPAMYKFAQKSRSSTGGSALVSQL